MKNSQIQFISNHRNAAAAVWYRSQVARPALLIALFLLPLIAACIAAIPAYPAQNDPLANLISRARLALGPGFDQVHALHLTSRVEVGGINGTIESWSDLTTGQYAESVSAGPFSGAEGYDANTAWLRDSKGIVMVQSRPRTEFINTVFEENRLLFSPNYGGAAVAYLGLRAEEGKSYEGISVTRVHGRKQEWWFDPATALLARQVVIARGHVTTVRPYDYESVGGLMIEHKVLITNDSGLRETIDVTGVDTNVRDLPEHLRRPATTANDYSLPGGATSVPIQLIDHQIFVDVMINGKGPFHFNFDSGGRNIIDPTVAWEVGAHTLGMMRSGGVGARSSEMQFTRVDQVSIGAATMTGQDFLVTELGPRSSYVPFGLTPKRELQGLIGYELPARFLTTIDYAAGRLTLRTPAAFRTAAVAGSPIPLLFDGTIPAVDCQLAGINATCELDTGSYTVLISKPFIDAHRSVLPQWFSGSAIIPLAPIRGIVTSGFGGWSKGQVGQLSSLGLGPNTIKGIDKTIFSMDEKGMLADPFVAALVGNPALERFTMTLDYPNATLWLVPNANPEKHYEASR